MRSIHWLGIGWIFCAVYAAAGLHGWWASSRASSGWSANGTAWEYVANTGSAGELTVIPGFDHIENVPDSIVVGESLSVTNMHELLRIKSGAHVKCDDPLKMPDVRIEWYPNPIASTRTATIVIECK